MLINCGDTNKSLKKENNIFFHIATIGNYQEIVNELVSQISKQIHNFSNVFVGLVGNGKIYLPDYYKILYINNNILNYEFITLNCIHEYCKNHNCNVLYIHSKGVSAIPELKACADNWRQQMAYFVIDNADKCIEYLKSYDVAGCDWRHEPVNHFSGNFWWSTSDHITRLPSINEIVLPKNQIWTHIKYNAEFWVGMHKDTKAKMLFDCGVHNYERHLYIVNRQYYMSTVI